jgi:hypothetical protein
MKILNSAPISPFGGLNFVLKEFDKLKIDQIFEDNLPKLSSNSKYNWKDILYSFWSIYFCGGESIEDLGHNFKNFLCDIPYMNVPSPDRILSRFKELSVPKALRKSPRGKAINELSENELLNSLNIKTLKKLNPKKYIRNDLTLDYDNTIIYTEKADAKNTYLKSYGYQPGVAIIGKDVVGVQNRNGNSVAYALQDETLKVMFENLESEGVRVKNFRADSASYNFNILSLVNRYVDNVFVRVKMSESVYEVINSIDKWKQIDTKDGRTLYRGSAVFTPFKKTAKEQNKKELLKEYKIVVTKEANYDGQLNMFTNEACVYGCIMTNDFTKTDDETVFFYNQRGATEREFDVLKNDFGWQHLPFSKLEQNTVFLILTAICRNLYNYIIVQFSKIYKHIKANFRIKKFIFRFVCIPGKWVKSGRGMKLRLYGSIAYKT